MTNALNNFIFQSKYAKYNSLLGRKEVFTESVDRIMNMHITYLNKKHPDVFNNPDFANDFMEAFEAYKQGKVYGSQRALQFGGDPILKKHCRQYNCAFTYADRLEVFKEIEWVLLCGCGAGISVEKQHIDKLPSMVNNLSTEVEDWKISDDIEGWAIAIDKLINYYFIEGSRYPKFDYSLIRPNGSLISGGFLAPGPDGLRNALVKIQTLLEKVFKGSKRMTPLNVTDIIAYCADSVLSGGVRRSAVIILFDPEDEEMYNSKTGDWFYTNPQRGRYNASAVLDRSTTSWDTFIRIFTATKEFGEPGFFWRSDKGVGTNPCQPKWAPVITPSGLSTIENIKEGDKIWSSEGWTTVTKKWSTGIKPVYKYRTTGGVFYGTENHRLVSNGVKIEAKDCSSVDSLSGCYEERVELNPQTIMDGIVIGDGYFHKASNNLVLLCIGSNDGDYHTSEISNLIKCFRPGIGKTSWEITTTVTPEELKKKYEIEIPSRFMSESKSEICSFLRGLYTANGSVVSNRITLKTTSPKLRDQVQLLLSYVGINSYYTTNKPTKVKFDNGEYLCKESYDVNISSDREKFVKLIGFIQKYKNDKIAILNSTKINKYNYPVKEVVLLGEEEVFDITVDNKSHTYWTGGLNVSNCCEIGFKPVINDKTGWQFCNLVTISGKMINTKQDFFNACKHAAVIGTIQAAYNEFPFLGETTEELIKSDPLIGVSISGIMCNPEILLNPDILKEGVEIVMWYNSLTADALGIKEASRVSCIKPDGNFSSMTGNTPGCHGAHSRRYIRRVQVNKEEEAGKIYKKFNPKAVVDSVWSNNHTDDCIMFAIEEDDDVILKSELLGVKQLDVVHTLYNNWVVPGNRIKDNPVQNNVSNTVIVPEGDWDKVANYIYDNRFTLAGVSFIPSTGDLDFNQPPYTEILLPSELIEKYGEGIIFASGLIVDAEKIFGDLWKACDAFNGIGEKLYASTLDAKEFIKEINISDNPELLDKPHSEWVIANNIQYDNWVKLLSDLNYSEEFIEEILDGDIEIPIAEVKRYLDKTAFTHVSNLNNKRDIMRRMKKYADKYFLSNYKLMINALKSVQLYHDWCNITKNYVEIDWSRVKWKNVLLNADEMAGASCSGGSCDITKI